MDDRYQRFLEGFVLLKEFEEVRKDQVPFLDICLDASAKDQHSA